MIKKKDTDGLEKEERNLWNSFRTKDFWTNYEDLIAQAKQQQAHSLPKPVTPSLPPSPYHQLVVQYWQGLSAKVHYERKSLGGCFFVFRILLGLGLMLFVAGTAYEFEVVFSLIGMVLLGLVVRSQLKQVHTTHTTFEFQPDQIDCVIKRVHHQNKENITHLLIPYDTINHVYINAHHSIIIDSLPARNV